METLLREDIAPFKYVIDNDAESIMAGHISIPQLTDGNNEPASLSRYFVTNLLRNELGFDGVVITDALGMGQSVSTIRLVRRLLRHSRQDATCF